MFLVLLSSMMITLSMLLLILQFFLVDEEFSSMSSLSPLESGFESLKMLLLISSPFFFLALLFVLFDLELIFLFPMVVNFYTVCKTVLLFSFVICLILLTLVAEWIWSGLKWQV